MVGATSHSFLRRHFTRRRFLQATAAAALTGLYTWRAEPHWLEITERDLPIIGLPPALAGKRLVQMTDLHIGPQVEDSYIVETFNRIATLQPDIVVHTGDLITYWKDDRPLVQARDVLKHFPHGRLGSFAILGNHDYGLSFNDPAIATKVETTLTAAGLRVLRNTATDVTGLQIVGLDDLWAGQFKPELAFKNADFNRPVLALSHNPDTCDLPGWAGHHGWILSGHTHGGPCKPPFLPPPLLPVKNGRYTSGDFALTGGRHLFISRGVGHLLRVRFNCRPEVVVFRLKVA